MYPRVVGAFSVCGSDEQFFGVNEQIFGADEQAPKGGCGPCPKNASGPGNSVRASKKCSALRVQSGEGRTSNVASLCLTCPGQQRLGLFPSKGKACLSHLRMALCTSLRSQQ